jgi:hypothetical protein
MGRKIGALLDSYKDTSNVKPLRDEMNRIYGKHDELQSLDDSRFWKRRRTSAAAFRSQRPSSTARVRKTSPPC